MAAATPLMIAQVGMGLMAAHNANQQANAQKKASQTAYQNRLNEVNARQAADEQRRKADLAQVSARQRARFGALG